MVKKGCFWAKNAYLWEQTFLWEQSFDDFK